MWFIGEIIAELIVLMVTNIKTVKGLAITIAVVAGLAAGIYFWPSA